MRSNANRLREYRARQKERGIPDSSRKNRKLYDRQYKRTSAKERPFIGCDGEGCGKDELGRQLYMLFRMGERELYTGERLRTEEILDFICDAPKSAILVGFAFDYDVTMILRDLSPDRIARLFQPMEREKGKSNAVWYKNFNITYLRKQWFSVSRVRIIRTEAGEKREVIKGSTRTIFETFGFFQKSFVKCLEQFQVGSKELRKSIAEDKERRSSFTEISERERSYCEQECICLADLMERLREYCKAAGIIPRTWNGAGKLAAALHKMHNTPVRKNDNVLYKDVLPYADMAYYGGRFEVSHVGSINQEVHEYDIHSAYPANMRNLPCLEHGTWEKVTGSKLALLAKNRNRRANDYFAVAGCSFKAVYSSNNDRPSYGGLPVRSPEGSLYWPLNGSGIYWNCEIESAAALGFEIQYKGGWLYHKNCDCQLFEWVEPLFNYRKSIGSDGAGYPIKLGSNSLYGKICQRIGNGRYTNMIWAGLITARTRAMINRAIALDPSNIIMVATDAVYSLRELEGLDCGDALGQWGHNTYKDLFIVQPGLYWSQDLAKKRSRGIGGSIFAKQDLLNDFYKAWKAWHYEQNSKLDTPFPVVPVRFTSFTGLKIANARGKPETAGCWIDDKRDLSFDYRNKRQGHFWQGDHIVTYPKTGFSGLQSLPHRDFLKAGGQEHWENARLTLEDQPDWVDTGPPFMD